MAETAKILLDIEAQGAATTLGQLEENAEALNEALRGAEIGSQEYKQLNDALVETNRQVKNLELGFEALDNEQVASEIGSVAGAISDVTGSLILLGGENESLEKMAANIQTALGVSMAFKGAIEGISSAQKLWTNLIKRYTIVQTVANGVTKAFNMILRANPIGLIVTAIGLLITGLVFLAKNVESVGNWFTELGGWVKSTIDGFGKWKYVILALLGPIGWLIAAWDYFFGEQAKHSAEELARLEREKKAREEANRQNVEDHKRRLNEIKERREAEKKAFDARQAKFDLDIERMEAEGKNAQALRIAKQEAVIQEIQDQIKAIREIEASWTEYYTRQAELQGKSREEYIKILKNQGIDVVALQEELNGEIEKLDQELFSNESKLIKLKLEGRKESAEEEVKIEEDKTSQIIEAQKEYLAFLDQKEKAENDYLNSKLDKETQELNAVREKYFGLIEEARQYGEDTTILEEAQQQALFDIEEKYRQQRIDAEKAAAEAEAQARIDAIDKWEQRAMKVLGAVENLQTIFHGRELKRIKEKRDRGEQLTKSEIKRLKREEQIRKAQALAQIVADTARGISAAVAAGAAAGPFPLNLPSILGGIAAVLSGVAQASQVIGESPDLGGAGGGISASGGGGTGGGTDNVPDLDPLNFGSTLLNQPNKVVVVETDITNVQNKVNVIEQQASFG